MMWYCLSFQIQYLLLLPFPLHYVKLLYEHLKRTQHIAKVHINSGIPLRKHVYSHIPKILPPKNENFQIKNSDIFHISAQNIDCGYSLEPPRRGGSNEYHDRCF